MARLVGVDLPRNKRMEVALTYIFGIDCPSVLNYCFPLRTAHFVLFHKTAIRLLRDSSCWVRATHSHGALRKI